MPTPARATFTAFGGNRRLASGPLAVVAVAAKAWRDRHPAAQVLCFDDCTGTQRELDLRGSTAELLQRLAVDTPAVVMERGPDASEEPGAASGDGTGATERPRGRGRPRLGVVAREVTLLPRHWDWLAQQPGGASATLRKLVEQARRGSHDSDRVRRHQEAAYRFMSAMTGDLPGFEEATRALFAGSRSRFASHTQSWPTDLRDYALMLANPALGPEEGGRAA